MTKKDFIFEPIVQLILVLNDDMSGEIIQIMQILDTWIMHETLILEQARSSETEDERIIFISRETEDISPHDLFFRMTHIILNQMFLNGLSGRGIHGRSDSDSCVTAQLMLVQHDEYVIFLSCSMIMET